MYDKYENYLSQIKEIINRNGEDYSKYNPEDKAKVKEIFMNLKSEMDNEIMPIINYWAECPINYKN